MENILSQLTDSFPFKSIFAIKKIEELSPRILHQLNEEELQQLESLQNEKRKREFVASRLLLRQLAEEWELPGSEFSVYKNTLGNPYAKTTNAQFEVSIAHTDRIVFCGLSSGRPIGVDAEPSDRTVSDRLRTRMMHPVEKKSGLDVTTVRLWTIKEAYIKLRGQGLRLNMNDVWVQQEGENFIVKLGNDKKAKICSFQYQDNWLAIAFYL